jgi:hypothetical protein
MTTKLARARIAPCLFKLHSAPCFMGIWTQFGAIGAFSKCGICPDVVGLSHALRSVTVASAFSIIQRASEGGRAGWRGGAPSRAGPRTDELGARPRAEERGWAGRSRAGTCAPGGPRACDADCEAGPGRSAAKLGQPWPTAAARAAPPRVALGGRRKFRPGPDAFGLWCDGLCRHCSADAS